MKINNTDNIKFCAKIKLKKPNTQKMVELGLLTTGVASISVGNITSSALSMNQSCNDYPMLGSQNLPQSYLNFAKESCLQKSSYDILYNPIDFGNETAFIPSLLFSSLGNSIGMSILKRANKSNI